MIAYGRVLCMLRWIEGGDRVNGSEKNKRLHGWECISGCRFRFRVTLGLVTSENSLSKATGVLSFIEKRTDSEWYFSQGHYSSVTFCTTDLLVQTASCTWSRALEPELPDWHIFSVHLKVLTIVYLSTFIFGFLTLRTKNTSHIMWLKPFSILILAYKRKWQDNILYTFIMIALR